MGVGHKDRNLFSCHLLRSHGSLPELFSYGLTPVVAESTNFFKIFAPEKPFFHATRSNLLALHRRPVAVLKKPNGLGWTARGKRGR
jgi:hypothetical protein